MATIIDSFIGAPSGHYSDAEIADTRSSRKLAADVEAEELSLSRTTTTPCRWPLTTRRSTSLAGPPLLGWAVVPAWRGVQRQHRFAGRADCLRRCIQHRADRHVQGFQDGREYTRTLSAWPEQSGRLYEPDINNQTYYTQSMLDNAKSFSDTAIVVIGRLAGESNLPPSKYKRTEKGGDIVVDDTRTMLELTTEEENLLNYVGANYAHVVVLINSTNVELGQTETIPGIDACLIAGLSGSEGATAVPEMLWVTANPAGVPPIPGLMT